MTRQRAVERSACVARTRRCLHETMPFIAHPAIRNRGTIGGSLAHADPAAELPAVMLALDARFAVRRQGRRSLDRGRRFFTGCSRRRSSLASCWWRLRIPPAGAARSGCAFQEMSRRHGDFALAGVAAAVALDADGRCAGARMALLSVGDRPVLAGRRAEDCCSASAIARGDSGGRRRSGDARHRSRRATSTRRRATGGIWRAC